MARRTRKDELLEQIEANRARITQQAEGSMPIFRVLDVGYQTVRFTRSQPFLATALSAIATRVIMGKPRQKMTVWERCKYALRWPVRVYALYQLATRAQSVYNFGSKVTPILNALLDDEFRMRTGHNRDKTDESSSSGTAMESGAKRA